MKQAKALPPQPARAKNPPPLGFSLVEIMVALVIGMIGVLIIMQVARTGEAQKRVTTGSGEAQNNAALGIYSVERDVKQAGYGFNSLNILGCSLSLLGNDGAAPSPARKLNYLAPVAINNTGMVPAGDEHTDTLLVIYGSSAGSPEGDVIDQQRSFEPNTSQQNIWVDNNARNFYKGEFVVAVPPSSGTPCNGINDSDGAKMSYVKEVDDNSVGIFPKTALFANGQLFNLGLTPHLIGYAIRGGNLTLCDYMDPGRNCAAQTTDWTPIANDIVSLRAQYGHEKPNEAPDWDQDTPANAKGWGAVSALRFVLVARNGEFDRNKITTAAPEWAGTSGAPIILPNIPGEGENYRYQTYETVVPLRNIPWMGVWK